MISPYKEKDFLRYVSTTLERITVRQYAPITTLFFASVNAGSRFISVRVSFRNCFSDYRRWIICIGVVVIFQIDRKWKNETKKKEKLFRESSITFTTERRLSRYIDCLDNCYSERRLYGNWFSDYRLLGHVNWNSKSAPTVHKPITIYNRSNTRLRANIFPLSKWFDNITD